MRTRQICVLWCLTFCVGLGLLMCREGLAATDYYVSLNGSDDNPGTKSSPFRTLTKARDVVRKVNANMTADIHVNLRGGTYRLEETVKFDQRDSGSNGHKVIYKAFGKETPIMSGGRRVTGWTLHDAKKNIYKAKVGALEFRQVYVNGRWAIRAREPNRTNEADMGPYFRLVSADDYLKAQHIKSGKNTRRTKIRKRDWDTVAGVSNIHQLEMVLQAHWYHYNLIYDSHTVEGDYVWYTPVYTPALPKHGLNKPRTFYEGRNGSSYFFANSYDLLDAEGEWYLDTGKDTLYYKPHRGENIHTARVDVPVLVTFLDIKGSKSEPVHDLEFHGVTFECSNWLSPSRNGLTATQFVQPTHGEYPPGMIKAARARRIAFRNGVVRNVGAHGIQFCQDVDDSDIEGNHIYNIAANAIEMGKYDYKYVGKSPRKRKIISRCENVAIWNNRITHAGRAYTNGGALMAHFVKGLIVEHNEISNMPYSGIQIGQQPGGYVDHGCHDNKIRYNHIHHCVQTRDDGGAVYTLGGQQHGTVISDNYIHDVVRSEWAQQWYVAGVYLDNYTQYVTIKNNVIENCTESAGQWNHAKDNNFIQKDIDTASVIRNAGIKVGYSPRP